MKFYRVISILRALSITLLSDKLAHYVIVATTLIDAKSRTFYSVPHARRSIFRGATLSHLRARVARTRSRRERAYAADGLYRSVAAPEYYVPCR